MENTNLLVSTQSTNDWYCLLRECQGSIIKVLESGYLYNHVDNYGIPCWQEYAYIINFDTNKLDFYDDSINTSYSFNNLPNWTD